MNGVLRAIADAVGAHLLFDAAHQCGIIAGKAWANPLDEGAHLMTMSTYKSLGGPPSGLIVSNDAAIAEKLDAIVGRLAALQSTTTIRSNTDVHRLSDGRPQATTSVTAAKCCVLAGGMAPRRSCDGSRRARPVAMA